MDKECVNRVRNVLEKNGRVIIELKGSILIFNCCKG
ncbi:hypothetical protein SAMN06298226_2505 [Nitrosovibrio sp. Nv4]|nr:hypothetical protein SAMN06298226_2505 [Nitrosovibrio sp. Nv4]